jgi:hypothetical protein
MKWMSLLLMIFISGSSLGAEQKLQITSANKVAEIDLVDGGKFSVNRENTIFTLSISMAIVEDDIIHIIYDCQFDGELGFRMGELGGLSFSTKEKKSYACGSKIEDLFILQLVDG